MDETPELAPDSGEVASGPLPPRVAAQTLIRDAVLDVVVAFFLGGIFILLTAGVLLLMSLDPGELLASGWGIAVMLLATQLPLLYRGLRRRRRNREKHLPVVALSEGPLYQPVFRGILTGAGLAVLSGIYTSALMKLLGPNAVESQLDFLKDMLQDRVAVAVLILMIAVVAPICEEIFFRGVVFGSARAVGLSKTGVAISAVLFAAVHLLPLLAPFYALFAVVMCWLYARTGTLAAPIAAHVTMNSLACLGLLLQENSVV